MSDQTFTKTTDRSPSRERQRSTESTTENEEEHAGLQCPECSGNVITDDEHGETVCDDCGLVITEDSVDRGPEWRAFDSAEKDQKSRVGAPTTNTMHDKGLSTNIDWRNKDAYGRSLGARQRQKMQRLRKWNERFRTRDSKERNLKQALGEIDRMASAVGLPDNVRETASGHLPSRARRGSPPGSLHRGCLDILCVRRCPDGWRPPEP
jgi:Transcription initiation factor IIB (TFIIB)